MRTLIALTMVSACNSNSGQDLDFPETVIDPIDQPPLRQSLWR
jgi:hypothetical protein